MSYDAVLIGSGHNCLLAAVLLARRGWRVVVFEGAPAPGGATRTEALTLPGFLHDSGSIIHSLFAVSPAYAALRGPLARHGLTYRWAETPVTSLFPDGKALTMHRGLSATVGELDSFHAGDGVGWQALYGRYRRGGALWTDLLYDGIGSPRTAWRGTRLAYRLGRTAGLETARDLLGSPGALAARYFAGPEARAWLAPWGLNAGFGPESSGGGLYTFLTALLAQHHGLPVPLGGSGALATALIGLLREHGGAVHTGMPVRQVLVRGGRAIGVQLAGGERIEARRAVIAGTAPGALFLDLVGPEHLSPAWLRRARGFRYGTGTFMLHLALRGAPRWVGGRQDALFAHIAPYVEDLTLAHAQALAGLLPADPFILAGTPSLLDPGRAPAGMHTLWVQVATAPSRIRGDAAGEIVAQDWSAAKLAFAARIIAKLERYAPGISTQIQGMCAMSPDDMQAANPNLVGGDLAAGSHAGDQQLIFRPLPGTGGYGTPIRDLYLIGASAYPGAGVSGASGWVLGRRLAGRAV